MDGIIIGITVVLSIAQVIAFIFVEPKIPIKLKETDTLQRIRKRKNNYLISILVICIFIMFLAYYGVKNQILIFGMIFAVFLIFLLTGAHTIFDRLQKKEKLLQGNNSFTMAMNKVNDMTLKDSIIIVDAELRQEIILDNVKEIKDMSVVFNTGETCILGFNKEILLLFMNKSNQDKIIKSNIKGVCLEELEGDKFKLIITTQSNNTFSATIEKVDLPKWIK